MEPFLRQFDPLLLVFVAGVLAGIGLFIQARTLPHLIEGIRDLLRGISSRG